MSEVDNYSVVRHCHAEKAVAVTSGTDFKIQGTRTFHRCLHLTCIQCVENGSGIVLVADVKSSV